MDSWPLAVQWAALVVVGGTIIGGSWWQTLARARADGAVPARWSGKVRMVVTDLGFTDWAFVALLATFFVPLTIRTIVGA